MLTDGGLVYGRGQRGVGRDVDTVAGCDNRWGHLLRAEGKGMGERTCGAGEKGRERGRRAESVVRARGKSASENGGLIVLIESTVSFVIIQPSFVAI